MFSAIIIFAKVMKSRIFTILLIFLYSCSGISKQEEVQTVQKPDWLLEEDKMVEIITDLRITDAALFTGHNGIQRNKKIDWAFIMKKHNTVDSIFIQSHDYYAGQPEVMDKIYEGVIDNLSEQIAQDQNQHP